MYRYDNGLAICDMDGCWVSIPLSAFYFCLFSMRDDALFVDLG